MVIFCLDSRASMKHASFPPHPIKAQLDLTSFHSRGPNHSTEVTAVHGCRKEVITEYSANSTRTPQKIIELVFAKKGNERKWQEIKDQRWCP